MTEFLIAYAYYPWVRIRLQGVMRRVLTGKTVTDTGGATLGLLQRR